MDNYAKAYKLDIDWVYANVRFDTLTAITIKWRKYYKFNQRFNELKSGLNQ